MLHWGTLEHPLLILQPFRHFIYVTAHSLNPSVALPTSPIILQPFCCFTYVTTLLILQTFRRFTYVTVHFSTLPSLYLRHRSFFNPFVASPTSQLILQPFFRFYYVTGSSLTSPGEPPVMFVTLSKECDIWPVILICSVLVSNGCRQLPSVKADIFHWHFHQMANDVIVLVRGMIKCHFVWAYRKDSYVLKDFTLVIQDLIKRKLVKILWKHQAHRICKYNVYDRMSENRYFFLRDTRLNF